jgi:hypothetical protein
LPANEENGANDDGCWCVFVLPLLWLCLLNTEMTAFHQPTPMATIHANPSFNAENAAQVCLFEILGRQRPLLPLFLRVSLLAALSIRLISPYLLHPAKHHVCSTRTRACARL